MSLTFELGAPWTWFGFGLLIGGFVVVLFSIKREPFGLVLVWWGRVRIAPERMQVPELVEGKKP